MYTMPNARIVARARRFDLEGIFGAGDGIRTHDPNLGKVSTALCCW
jgi:hypothetical protein